MKNNKGFTLVEILAVLVLISLMMVIIVPNVQKVALNSKIKLCKSKINLAEESINLWARDNYKCFEKTDGCNILSNCQTNNDTIKCESTFKTLAENNLLNYDKNIKNTNYVINPINNGNMNDTKIFIEFNQKNKQVKSYIDDTLVDKVCSKNASDYNDPIVEGKETTTTRTTTTTTTTSTTRTTTTTTKPIVYSFANDSWTTIANNVRNGLGYKYNVGDEKEVSIGGTNYTVRVANNTTPSECSNEGFSQTACGFVVEFVDIVEQRQMNSSHTNVGGWPAMKLHGYANGDFFNKLPEELRNVIINTTVVSGHGWSNSSSNRSDGNWESQDKIYLLNTTEVWSGSMSRDRGYNKTRQLDYYKGKGVNTSNYFDAIKQYNNSDSTWWLRAADSDENYDFFVVDSSGNWRGECGANDTYGFAPAFRIG